MLRTAVQKQNDRASTVVAGEKAGVGHLDPNRGPFVKGQRHVLRNRLIRRQVHQMLFRRACRPLGS